MHNPVLNMALHYAVTHGWRTLPVRPRDKIPMLKNWTEEASSDPDTVTRMFSNHNGNIGVACGVGSGIVVIDIDLPHGMETMKTLEVEFGSLPSTLSQRTGSGGRHLVFRYPKGRMIRGTQGKNGHGLGEDVDVRAEGNQIVVAPSIHKNGKPYVWENNLPIASLPAKWVERLESQNLQKGSASQKAHPVAHELSASSSGLSHPFLKAAIQYELAKMLMAPEGERNNTLFRIACSIGGWIPNGHLSYHQASELLFQAAEANGYVASDGAEATKATIMSGLSKGQLSPRQIPYMPPGFSVITGGALPGLYYREPAKEEGSPPKDIYLGPPLSILGRVRDEASDCWGILLQWQDPDNVIHSLPLPYEMLAGKDPAAWRSLLADGGWIGVTGKRQRDLLARYLNESQPVQRVLSVPRTGWHGGAFVLPENVVYYPPDVPTNSIVLQSTTKNNPYRQSGTMEGWRNTIGKMAEGNSRLMLALCASLAAILLELTSQESGGFNWIGSSSTGKTTALLMAGSVWGKGSSSDGYVLSWRSTDNALEAVAALHSDTVLCLDELSQASARVVSQAAYMLGNGKGKSRADRTGGARPTKNWRCMILSSGEQSIDDKLRSEGMRVQAGQAVRLIDIPADAGCGMGLFENLHGHAGPQAFADALRRAATVHYGHAAQEFIRKVVSEYQGLLKLLPENMARIATGLADDGSDGQVQRVSKKFALCIIAGKLATAWGILPWQKGSANQAISSIFRDWLAYRGGIGATEDIQIIRQVTHFIEQHGNSRFQLSPSAGSEADFGTCHNRAGFREVKDNRTVYYVLPESFRNELCKGFNSRKATQVLRDAGILRPGDGHHLQSKPPRDLPGWGRKRCYILSFDSQENE